MRMLIIEDNSIIATDLEIAGSDLGFSEVSVALDETEALESAKTLHPDVLLCDVRLGAKGSGVRAANAILREGATAIVFVTGLLSADACIVNDGVVTLGKPYKLNGLRHALRCATPQPAGSNVDFAVARV